MEVLGRERRRRWSVEEKQGIVAEASQAGVSASWVARRYGIAPSQLFAWRKQFREEAEASFLPVVVEEEERQAVSEGRIEVSLAQGHRLSAPVSIDPERLGRLLRVVARA